MRRALFLICAVFACATPRSASVDADEAAARLRESLAKSPGDIHGPAMQDQLVELEFERTRKANTILAYRQFLNDFPNTDEAATARVLLEELQFRETLQIDTRQAWEDFLDEHPRGKHAGEAREHLGSIEIAAALKSSNIDLVRQTLARFPEHPHRDALVTHEDDLAWATALTGGIDSVDAYLTSHPTGTHRLAAEQRRDILEQQEILDSEDLARAETRAKAADATARRRATVAALKLARGLAALNMNDIQAVASIESAEPEVLAIKAQAATFLADWNARPLSPELATAVAAARPGAGLRPHDETVSRTRGGDPVEQIAALRELAEWSRPADVDVALSALNSHYIAVRLAAVECLRSLASSLKPAVWRALERAHEETTLAQSRDDAWIRVAALRDASGRTMEAIEAWRAALRVSSDDLLAQARVFALLKLGNDRLALNTAARDLAKSAIAYGSMHVPPPADPTRPPPAAPGVGEIIGVPRDLSAARQICAAVSLASKASAVLAAESQSAPQEERELLQLARDDNEKATLSLRAHQIELEQGLIERGIRVPPCDADVSAEAITKARSARAAAVTMLAKAGDSRLRPFIESLQYTPAPEVRAAVRLALRDVPIVSGRQEIVGTTVR